MLYGVVWSLSASLVVEAYFVSRTYGLC